MQIPTNEVKKYFLTLQNNIVRKLESISDEQFNFDKWDRTEGGGGISRYIENANLFERGAVLFSHVCGNTLPKSASARRTELAGRPWEAMGVSLVLHPRNPHVPTSHMNVRLFVAHPTNSKQETVFWFGGGLDLTPYYPYLEDVKHFHSICKKAVNKFGADKYQKYKKWCDDYFYLKHRDETRGVGGLFFDDINESGFDQSFKMIQSVGNSFTDAYIPIVEKRRNTPYGDAERSFQAYRRGRYVEFNLVFDRGTLFGLQSGGRTESILLSMPPTANWRYMWEPEPDSPEYKLQNFLKPQEWI